MHESSVTEAIIKIVVEKALENKAKKVLNINLAVGELTGFIGDSIQFYFDRYSKDTIAYGAVLNIRYIKPEFKCSVCGNLFQKLNDSISCPLCGGDGHSTKIGQEFFVENIEIE
jgi:hydrogenase nickel incorporation protein HypA/HybF